MEEEGRFKESLAVTDELQQAAKRQGHDGMA
jgi:hypothetical protein